MAKVLHIVYSGLGGIAAVSFSLISADKASAGSAARYQHAIAFYGSVPTLQDYADRCTQEQIEYASILRKSRIDFTANLKLLRWMFRCKPDVVIVNLPRSLLAGLLYRLACRQVRLIGVEHHPNVLKGRIDWMDSRLMCRFCDHVVYLTDAYRSEVQSRIGGSFNKRKSVVIGNGIDTSVFTASRAAATTDGVVRIGMCSRLSDEKDIDTLLAAIQTLSVSGLGEDFVLTFAGDGPYQQELEAVAAKRGIADKVTFEGRLALDELLSWFQSLDTYVHATLSEAMSTSVMQAAASGLPIVASDITGMHEIVKPEFGQLVKPGDAAGLADALKLYIVSSSRRIEHGLNAREYAKTHMDKKISWDAYTTLMQSEVVNSQV